MARRTRGNRLERWEIAIVKAMLARGGYNDQDILSYFTRPTRTINHARIQEIRTEYRHRSVSRASDDELDEFLTSWPILDPETGLNAAGDELLIKAREAMIAAVHTFNGAGLTFRAELFIVTAIIAWTYLLHAWFKSQGIDYRHKVRGRVQKTREGAEKYLELSACLKHARSPVEAGVARNLNFLLKLRHEIEHRSTSRLDETVSAKLQACCINFNQAIKSWFGSQFGLERRLPIALQFVTFDADQRSILKKASNLPGHIETAIDHFEELLSDEEYQDPAYRFRVAFVPISKQRASASDLAIEFVRSGSEEADEINRILVKEVERNRFTASQVIRLMNENGFPNFGQYAHTQLWRELDGKNPGHGYGRPGDYPGTWVWYDRWVERVRAHCEEQGDRYR